MGGTGARQRQSLSEEVATVLHNVCAVYQLLRSEDARLPPGTYTTSDTLS